MRRVWITGAAVVIEARGTMRRGTVQSASMDARTLVLEFDGRIGDWERLMEVTERGGEFRDVLTNEVIKLREPPPLMLVGAPVAQPLGQPVEQPMREAVGQVGGSTSVPASATVPPSRPRIIDLAQHGNGSSRFRDNRPSVAVGSAPQPTPSSFHATASKPLTFSLGEKIMLQASGKLASAQESPVPTASKATHNVLQAQAMEKMETVFVFVRDYIREHGVGPRLETISKGTGFSSVMSATYVRRLRAAKRISYDRMDYRTMVLGTERRPKKSEPPPAPPQSRKSAVSALTPKEQARREKLREAALAKAPMRSDVRRAIQHKEHLYRAVRVYVREHKTGPTGPELCRITGYNQARVSAYMRLLRDEGRIAYEASNYRTTKIVRQITPEGRQRLVEAGRRVGALNRERKGQLDTTPPAPPSAPATSAIVPGGSLARGAIVTHGEPVAAHPLKPLRQQLRELREQWNGQLGALVSLTTLFQGKDAAIKPSESAIGSTALPVPSIAVSEEMVRVRGGWQKDIDALDRVLSALGDRIELADDDEGEH